MFSHRAADLACTTCDTCDEYEPVELIDHISEISQYGDLLESKNRRNAAQSTINWISLGLMVVGLVTTAVAPGLYPWTILPAVVLALGNTMASTYLGRRDGLLGNGEVLVNVMVTVSVGVFVAALIFEAPTPVIVASVAIMFGALFVFLWQSRHDLVRAQRGLDTTIAQLKASDDDT
jgi:FtsH-binding integral membrane protein